MTYLVFVAAVLLLALRAAWAEYSHDVFAMTCVFFAVGAWAALKASAMSARTPPGRVATAEGGYGCLYWIAWHLGGAAAILLLGAAYSYWF